MKKLVLVLILMAYGVSFLANKTMEKTVGFDFDSTLAFTLPSFMAEKAEEPSERLDWELLNGRLLQLEKKKRVAWLVPLFKFFGYTPIVISARPEIKGEVFRTHVQRNYGITPEDVYMTKERATVLKRRNVVIFFGDSDGDITEAQRAGIIAVRVKRSADESHRDHYNPGRYGEFILPFSEGHF